MKICCARRNKLCCAWLLIGQNFVTDQSQARRNRACLTGLLIANLRLGSTYIQVCPLISWSFGWMIFFLNSKTLKIGVVNDNMSRSQFCSSNTRFLFITHK